MSQPPITKSSTGPEKSKQQQQTSWQQLVGSRRMVLSLLFFVMAILGLPLLWISPAFSLVEKWLLSIVVIIYTIALFAITLAIVWWAWARIQGVISSVDELPFLAG